MKLRSLLPLTVLTVALAQGQMGPGPGRGPMPGQPPAPNELKAYLNLTDSQIRSLEQLRQQETQVIGGIADEIRQKERALRDLLDKGTTDANAVGKLVIDIEALRKRIQQLEATARDAARNLLTADQKAKLKGLDDAMKLQPAIQQAIGLNLLDPPNPPPGIMGPGGMGPGFMRPGGMGPGPGFVPRGEFNRRRY